MSSKKPVILFVHGAWHTIAHYQTFLDILKTAGYTVVAPTLPSNSDPVPENATEADVKLFSETALKLAEEGHEIIAVSHSYGGVVSTEAFTGLGIKNRKSLGLQGGIRTIVCIAGFLLGTGMTLEGSSPVETLGWCAYEGDRKIFVQGYDIGEIMYPDIPKDEQEKWLKLTVNHPKSCSFHSPKSLSYMDIETVFIYCEKDVGFPYPAQIAVVQALKSQGAKIQEETLPSGHFPSLSMPDKLAEIVLKYA